MLRIFLRGFIIYELVRAASGALTPRPRHRSAGPARFPLAGLVALIGLGAVLYVSGAVPRSLDQDAGTHIEWEGTLPPEAQN